jgi:hypothetical protein
MTVLEVGINLGLKNLIDLKYYSPSDKVIDSSIRAKFLTGLENFISEVYADKVNVISFSDYKIVCIYKMVQLSHEDIKNPQPLLVFAIIEKSTDPEFVKKHLKEIRALFLEKYDLDSIFLKEPKTFKQFEKHINDILGDLRLKIEDRIGSLFG